MEVEFISKGKVLYTGHITEKIHLNSNTFSIPISAFSEKDSNEYLSSPGSEYLNKKTDRKNFEDSFEGINTQLIKKKKYDNDFDESDEEDLEEESEEYEGSENMSDDEENIDSDFGMNNSSDNINNKNSDFDNSINNSDKNININISNNKIRGDLSESSSKNQRLLRKYGAISDKDSEYYGLNKGHKKVKRELTEEKKKKKTEQARLRKLHAKKLIEDEKREAVERILNEDGRKLRERQKNKMRN